MRQLQLCALLVSFVAATGCSREQHDCKIVPCPAPGFDVEKCTCFPGTLLGTAGAGGGGSSGTAAPDGYACGSSTCDANTQTCEHVSGGAPPGVDFYSCIALPSACTNDVTCACLKTALLGRGANQCDGDNRHLTVRIDVP